MNTTPKVTVSLLCKGLYIHPGATCSCMSDTALFTIVRTQMAFLALLSSSSVGVEDTEPEILDWQSVRNEAGDSF